METQANTDLLLACCAGRLDAETTLILQRHLAGCPACREFLAGQQAVWQALDAWEAAPVTADFDRRLYRRIEAEAQSSWWNRLMHPLRPVVPEWIGRGVPLAATLCLLLIAGIILERPTRVVAPEDMASDVRTESIQPEQVERTLDQMELLRQFRANTTTDPASVNAM